MTDVSSNRTATNESDYRRRGRLHCWVALAALLVAMPFMVIAMLKLSFANDDVRPWFPEDTAERDTYTEFIAAFGEDDFVVAALDNGKNGNDREIMSGLADAVRELDGAGLVALADVRVGRDGSPDSLVLKSSTAGARDRAGVYAILQAAADGALDQPTRDRLRFAGPVYMGAVAEQETEKTLRGVAPLTAGLSVLAALLLLRDFRLALIAFTVSSIAATVAIAMIHFTKGSVSNMLNIVPSIAQLLAMSNAVHLLHYYCDCDDTEIGAGRAWLTAFRKGLKPTVAASVTTMIGLGSLWVSHIPVVREFAVYGALGVLGSMLAVLLFVPAALCLVRPPARRGGWLRERVTTPLCTLTARRSWLLSAVLGALAITMGLGLQKLGPEVRMETFFSKQSKFSKDLAWFQENFGPLEPCEVLFRFPAETNMEDSLAFFTKLEQRFAAEETSAGWKIFSPASIPLTGLSESQLIEALQSHGRVAIPAGATDPWWRTTVQYTPDPDPTDSAALDSIRSVVADEIASSPPGLAPSWELTGSNQLFSTAQAGLLGSLLKSFFFAVLFIAPLTMFFLGSVRLGAVAMLGNIFPLVVFFGALGWLGVRIDIATMMIASVAFGVAVDDTIHFLNWFAAGDRTRPVTTRMRSAFDHSATAIIQTTTIISVGMLAFAISDFIPSQRFALFTSIVLGLAVVGDLVLLPSLVQGPLRRWLGTASDENS